MPAAHGLSGVKPTTERVDAFQRRHPVVGLPLAVTYKFNDDQGSYLAVVVTHYATLAIFPLLLVSTSVLGFLLQGDPGLERTVLASALAEFPVVGTQLATQTGLQGSWIALAVGVVTALYGVVNPGQAVQNTQNVAWGVPRNARPDPIVGRLRSAGLILTIGSALVVVAVAGSLATHASSLGGAVSGATHLALTALSLLVTAAAVAGLLKLSVTPRQSFRTFLPGGVFIGLGWHLLQQVGGLYVGHSSSRPATSTWCLR